MPARRCSLVLVLTLLLACERTRPPAPPPPPTPDAGPADAGPPDAGAPDAGQLASYVGSRACQECHADEHKAWSQDWHARALSPATPAFVAGRFDNAHFKGASSEAWMKRRGAGYAMRTAGVDGGVADFPVDWVVGGKRMQDTLTAFPDGRWQILPVYFHVTGKGAWVDYTEAKQGALSPDHPFYWANFRRNANHECLDCHTTGLQVRYDAGAHAWSTRMADPGVACESCHGPGSRHAESQDPADLFRPDRAPAELALAACAQCHGPREPLFPMLDDAHRFRAGDRYEDHYQALVVVDGRERSGDYFADGRPKTSSFEYQALIQSRCYREGGATCLSCHTAPHAKHGFDEVKPGPADAASCQGCHAPLFAERAAHSHHQSKAAQDCLACHMPRVVTGVLDTFADHALDVPAPRTTAAHGVPNACGTCHADRKPEALQAQMETWWPKVKERQARRERLADALDEATAARSLPSLRAVLTDAAEAPTLRGAAAELLAQRFPAEATPTLAPLLRDPSPVVRSKAVRGLAGVRDRAAAEALALLLRDPSLWVRQDAALALGSRGDPRGEAALRALAADPATAGLPKPHRLLAYLLQRRGDLAGAAREFAEVVRLQPYDVEALLALAALQANGGRTSEARAWLEEALRFDPSSKVAREGLRQLK